MQESITEIIRVCVGSFLVIYGYIMSIIERYLGMPFFGSRYQPKGVINGFVATLAGAVLMSITVQRFYVDNREVFRYAVFWIKISTKRSN